MQILQFFLGKSCGSNTVLSSEESQQELYNSCSKSLLPFHWGSLQAPGSCLWYSSAVDFLHVLQTGSPGANTQRGNAQKLLITPQQSQGRPESQCSGMLPKHTTFKDEAQGEVYHKFGPSYQTLRQPADGEVRMNGVTEQRWHFVTQGNGLAMPWGLSLQENWICTMVQQGEKSLQSVCARRAVSGELASSVAENSMTRGQLRAAMGIFPPSPPLSSPAIEHSGQIL